MSKIDDGAPAFPTLHIVGDEALSHGGLTIRDYFAATIDIPLEAVEAYAQDKGAVSYEQMITWRAQMRYAEADAMLRERAKAESGEA